MLQIRRHLRCLFAATLLTISTSGTAWAQGTERQVLGTILHSPTLPAVELRVAPGFRYVGRIPFRIRDVADGERFVFARIRSDTVQALVIAQFEQILPTSDEAYRYSFDGAPLRAGYRFRENALAFSHREAAAENPLGEATLTLQLLRHQGWHLTDEVMTRRYLTVPDSARKHEMIVFYLEPLEPGVRLSDLYAEDEETPRWVQIASALRTRAEKAFELRPLGTNGGRRR